MGLMGILSIANQSLQAQQAGLTVTANNIANVNTPGYTRQVVTLAEQAPFGGNPASTGGGVSVQGVQNIRDAVLQIRINQETQTQNSLTSLQQQLSPVEAMFSTTGGAGLGTAISGFFNSLQQLSTNPADGAQRQSVISAAQIMSQTFQQVASGIAQQRAGADQTVVQQTDQANGLLGQIAKLNGQIADAQSAQQNAGALVDQRDNLLGSLSGLIGFTTSDGGNGQVTLTTAQGAPLVVGTQAASLSTGLVGGVHDVFADGVDITTALGGGSLAGLVQARDQVLPQLSGQLDQLAGGIATAINTQNQAGFTATGAAGGNLFTPPPATGAAAALSLATTDPNAIAAASSPSSPGDNSNLLALEALQQQPIAGGLTPAGAYANVVSSLGSVIQGANTQQQASSMVLTQLQNQRAAVSGVSMDEESIQLNQFQTAFQAAAKVVTAINNLASLAINLGKD